MNDQFKITDAIITDTRESLITGDYRKIVGHTKNNHTDSFSIYLTHDIDWLTQSHPYVYVNLIRSIFFNHPWIKFNDLFKSNLFLDSIFKLADYEHEQGIQATYNLGSENGLLLGRHQIRYSSNSPIYKDCLQALLKLNHHIGLHSSYKANQKGTINAEKNILEQTIHTPIQVHRSHYLHYNTSTLYRQLDVAGFKYDVGFGQSKKMGFKNNFPGKFKPIQLETGVNASVTVIPLIMLDNIFFNQPKEFIYRSFKECLFQLKNYTGSACIAFHPENLLIKPSLFNNYRDFIDICLQMGANINPNY